MKKSIIIIISAAMVTVAACAAAIMIALPAYRFNNSVTAAQQCASEGDYGKASAEYADAVHEKDTQADVWVSLIDAKNQIDDFYGAADCLYQFLSKRPEYYDNLDKESLQNAMYDVSLHAKKANVDIGSAEEVLVNNGWDKLGLSLVKTGQRLYAFDTVDGNIIYEFQRDDDLVENSRDDHFPMINVGDVRYIMRDDCLYKEEQGTQTEIADNVQLDSAVFYDDMLFYILDDNSDKNNLCLYDAADGSSWTLPVHTTDIRYIIDDCIYLIVDGYLCSMSIYDIRGLLRNDIFLEHPTEVFHPKKTDGIVIGNWQYVYGETISATNMITAETRVFDGLYGSDDNVVIYGGNIYVMIMNSLYKIDSLLAKVKQEADISAITVNKVMPEIETDTYMWHADEKYIYIEVWQFNKSPIFPNTIYRADVNDLQFAEVYECTKRIADEG